MGAEIGREGMAWRYQPISKVSRSRMYFGLRVGKLCRETLVDAAKFSAHGCLTLIGFGDSCLKRICTQKLSRCYLRSISM